MPISVINGNRLQPISATETERYKLWAAEKHKANIYLNFTQINQNINAPKCTFEGKGGGKTPICEKPI